jgi:gluconokinase
MRVVRPQPVTPVPLGLFAHRLPDGTSLLGGQLSEGGGVVAAVARLVGATPRRLDALAATLPPDGHGLTVLPFLAGERGPGYDARARGTVDGLTLATTPADLYLASIEAIALRFAHLDRTLTAELGQAPEVAASGGAVAGSTLFPEVLAAALGRPVAVSGEGEASARGAAILALVAAGVIPGPESVGPPPRRTIVADAARAAAYRRAGERQAALYGQLRGG